MHHKSTPIDPLKLTSDKLKRQASRRDNMLLNEIYDKLAEEWQMTSEEVQNAIYKEWYKKYHQNQQTSEQKG